MEEGEEKDLHSCQRRFRNRGSLMIQPQRVWTKATSLLASTKSHPHSERVKDWIYLLLVIPALYSLFLPQCSHINCALVSNGNLPRLRFPHPELTDAHMHFPKYISFVKCNIIQPNMSYTINDQEFLQNTLKYNITVHSQQTRKFGRETNTAWNIWKQDLWIWNKIFYVWETAFPE